MTADLQRSFLVILALVTLVAPHSPAHEVESIPAIITIGETTWRTEVQLDSVFIADNLLRDFIPEQSDLEWLRGLDDEKHEAMRGAAEGFLRDCFQLAIGSGEPLPMTATFPDFATTPLDFIIGANGIPAIRIVLAGSFEATPEKVQLRWYAEDAPDLAVDLRFEHPQLTPYALVIVSGQVADIDCRVEEPLPTENATAPSESWFWGGFVEVLPHGPKYILFLLGVVLLAPGFRSAGVQALVFILASSLSCWIWALFFPPGSPQLASLLVAATLAYLGLENLRLSRITTRRIVTLSICGLIHGLAFAHTARHLSVSSELSSALAFNLGFVLAQLAVIAFGATLMVLFVRNDDQARRVRMTGSLFIILAGAYWTAERLLGA